MTKNLTQITLKQLTRILKIGLGIRAGAGEALERLIQHRHNPLLLFK